MVVTRLAVFLALLAIAVCQNATKDYDLGDQEAAEGTLNTTVKPKTIKECNRKCQEKCNDGEKQLERSCPGQEGMVCCKRDKGAAVSTTPSGPACTEKCRKKCPAREEQVSGACPGRRSKVCCKRKAKQPKATNSSSDSTTATSEDGATSMGATAMPEDGATSIGATTMPEVNTTPMAEVPSTTAPATNAPDPDCIKKYGNSKHTACLKSSRGKLQDTEDADKKAIVDIHNQLRAIEGATDMQMMAWDDELAMIAENWAVNCKFANDKMEQRDIPGRFTVGQNLGYHTLAPGNWENILKIWWSDRDNFRYGTGSINGGKKVNRYTQMAWAKSSKVGCALAFCPNLPFFYVCNYGPAGNVNSRREDMYKPYTQGEKGSACGKKTEDGLCDCGGMACHFQGKLDLKTCSCKCQSFSQYTKDASGQCHLDCSKAKEQSICGKKFTSDLCGRFSHVPGVCPKMCGIC